MTCLGYACACESKKMSTARFECGVCWNVYDPASGDDAWQIPAGTAFEALPAYWTCPNCAAERSRFLELADA